MDHISSNIIVDGTQTMFWNVKQIKIAMTYKVSIPIMAYCIVLIEILVSIVKINGPDRWKNSMLTIILSLQKVYTQKDP